MCYQNWKNLLPRFDVAKASSVNITKYLKIAIVIFDLPNSTLAIDKLKGRIKFQANAYVVIFE